MLRLKATRKQVNTFPGQLAIIFSYKIDKFVYIRVRVKVKVRAENKEKELDQIRRSS